MEKKSSANDLFSLLRESIVSGRIFGHYDISLPGNDGATLSVEYMFRDYGSGKFDTIILAVDEADFKSAIRRLRMIQGVDAPIWLPTEYLEKVRSGGSMAVQITPHLAEVREELTEKHGMPLMVIVPPCAGTMRFLPQIENLLSLLGWTAKSFTPLTCNPYFFGQFRDSNKQISPENLDRMAREYVDSNTQAYYWLSKSLRHYEYVNVHDHSINLESFRTIPCKIIVLMRDPRDIFNSIFYRNYPFDEEGRSEEKFMLDLLDGENFFFSPEYGYRWASAKEWCDSYLAAMDSPNMEIVRFEDLHRDEIGTLRDLLIRLELFPNPFVDITDDSLRIAARLGSFEHQTNGQASRGEDRQWIVGQTSCRKGVVGDWRSTFTPAVVEKFKEMTGDALIRLGYEDSMDWGLDQPEPS